MPLVATCADGFIEACTDTVLCSSFLSRLLNFTHISLACSLIRLVLVWAGHCDYDDGPRWFGGLGGAWQLDGLCQCGPGSYLDRGAATCASCPVGTWSEVRNQSMPPHHACRYRSAMVYLGITILFSDSYSHGRV